MLNEAFGIKLDPALCVFFFRKDQGLWNMSLVQISMVPVVLTLLLHKKTSIQIFVS